MKRSVFYILLLFFLILIFSKPLFSSVICQGAGWQQDTTSKGNVVRQPVYTTTRLVTSRPVIDGSLDDDCWMKGTWAGNYTQLVPREGARPTYPTWLNIQYDNKYLYIAFRSFDGEPDRILKLAGVRDETIGDMVGVSFDSYHDYRTGFEFTMTAWGQKVDLVHSNPMNADFKWNIEDFNWNAVWKGKVGFEDSAWVAELEVPLSQLRYSNKDEQVWGMHTWRWISRLQEESNWEIQSRTGPGMLYNYGEFRGIKGLKKSRRLEILPFAVGDLRTMKEVAGNPFTKNGRDWDGNIGLDAKIGLSSNFTVDLTVNPDFGQVESDPSIMNLTAFETLYEEKRPFFLEGLTIFDYKFDDQNLFYSRRIGQSPSLIITPNDSLFIKSRNKTTILSAVKLSGTTSNGLSVGLIQSVTANEYARISNNKGNRYSAEVEPLTSYTVARIQKGYNAGNTVLGGMITSANRDINNSQLRFLSSDVLTGGLDFLHHWKDKEFFVDARLLGSYINGSREAIKALQESSAHYFQRPGADYLNYDTTRTSLSGAGGKFRIGKGSKGFWRYSTGASWLSPGLELNDIGYMISADKINQENVVSYFINQPVSIFRSYDISLEQFNSWNFNGTYLGSGGHFSFRSVFINQWSFSTNLIFHSKAIDTRVLRGGYDMMMPFNINFFGSLSSDKSKNTIGKVEYNYTLAGNNSARSFQIQPGITIRPFRALKIGVTGNYTENQDNLQYVATREYFSDMRYILGTIDQTTLGLTLRLDLNLTPEFSIQYYGSPFVSRGTFSGLKHVTNPLAENYKERFALYDNAIFSAGYYLLDENSDMVPDYSIQDPDFNFHQFRSNFVAKWEYRLGSFIYFVWSSERTGRNTSSEASVSNSYRQLRSVFPDNIFLIKLNYWFSL
jgi:hypothetical protein